MTTATLDRFGRVLIPKPIRDNLGLQPGAELTIEDGDSQIVLKPTEQCVPVKVKNGVLVFTGQAQADLTKALQEQRSERLRRLAGMGET